MSKERRMDFVIGHDIWDDEDNDIVFRFYPKSSHMHGFEEDKPPKSFNAVYKVYYSWAIIHKYQSEPTRVLFRIGCDECSALTDLSESIRYVLAHNSRSCLYSPGQEGSIWEIEFQRGRRRPKWDYSPDMIQFSVFSNWMNKDYRFRLTDERAKKFADFLDRVNQHMLENAEGI